MAQLTKMESQVDIKSSAEKFFQTFCNKQNELPEMCPNVVKNMQLIKGDWQSVGSIRKWIFVPGAGSSDQIEYCTVIVEAIDDKNKIVRNKAIEGEILMKLYNSYRFIIQAIDKADGSGSVVKTTIEYEKKNEAVPDPTAYLDFAAALYKTMDAHLINNA